MGGKTKGGRCPRIIQMNKSDENAVNYNQNDDYVINKPTTYESFSGKQNLKKRFDSADYQIQLQKAKKMQSSDRAPVVVTTSAKTFEKKEQQQLNHNKRDLYILKLRLYIELTYLFRPIFCIIFCKLF